MIQACLGLTLGGTHVMAAMKPSKFDDAVEVLQQSTDDGAIAAASLYVRHRQTVLSRSFGAAKSEDAAFLLGSISKPIAIAAVMTLLDQGSFALDDPARKYLPEFTGGDRDRITIRQLMTHCSGLPDQLRENAKLRAAHEPLDAFVQAACRTPLLFVPGTRYSYSSMAILLACEIAQRISGKSIATLVDQSVCQPLRMKHSALGTGRLRPESLMRCQVEKAAPESGAGDPATKDWDWNSSYWRTFGAPWGGVHASAADVARFLDAFLHPEGKILQPETARLMITNQNPPGLRPRGLGFDLGKRLSGSSTSDKTFGHSGSTGTLCWADPDSDSIFVVLTTLPSEAVDPHPRETTSRLVAEAIALPLK